MSVVCHGGTVIVMMGRDKSKAEYPREHFDSATKRHCWRGYGVRWQAKRDTALALAGRTA